MNSDPNRSRAARESAERALVQVVHEYGKRPEFVVLGGLVPELLCSTSDMQHAGTTDIDVQVDLEIACGSVNAARLEQALLAAGFTVAAERKWRWMATAIGLRTEVKFELLADLDDQPAHATISFDGCEKLGAANLRGTGFAADDVVSRDLTAVVGGTEVAVETHLSLWGMSPQKAGNLRIEGGLARRLGTEGRICGDDGEPDRSRPPVRPCRRRTHRHFVSDTLTAGAISMARLCERLSVDADEIESRLMQRGDQASESRLTQSGDQARLGVDV